MFFIVFHLTHHTSGQTLIVQATLDDKIWVVLTGKWNFDAKVIVIAVINADVVAWA